jgi:hypothetical protein
LSNSTKAGAVLLWAHNAGVACTCTHLAGAITYMHMRLGTTSAKCGSPVAYLCRPLLLGIGIKHLTLDVARALLASCKDKLAGAW